MVCCQTVLFYIVEQPTLPADCIPFIQITVVLLLKGAASNTYADVLVSIMYGLWGCRRASIGRYTNFYFSILKAPIVSVIGSDQFISFFLRTNPMRVQTILKLFSLNLLFAIHASQKDCICVLFVWKNDPLWLRCCKCQSSTLCLDNLKRAKEWQSSLIYHLTSRRWSWFQFLCLWSSSSWVETGHESV